MLAACSRFKLLATTRAGALHAARAPSREVCVSLANDLREFFGLLAQSARINPYVGNPPGPPQQVVEKTLQVGGR
ncbi:MAG: hypothetical protein OXU20_17650, partial [Myxococcales bacterium]|nr:hypothetical protein [Myxococcales bacterium]